MKDFNDENFVIYGIRYNRTWKSSDFVNNSDFQTGTKPQNHVTILHAYQWCTCTFDENFLVA